MFQIGVHDTYELVRGMSKRITSFLRLKGALLLLIASVSDQAVAQRAGDPKLPNPALTPGATLEVGQEGLCSSEYSSPANKIPITLKRQTFDRYGLKPGAIGYNVDHLIPSGLGGSNSPKNLWPQSLSGEWNYHMKNRLERALKKMVCRKEIALDKAQQEIAADWITAYKRYVSKQRKRSSKNPS